MSKFAGYKKAHAKFVEAPTNSRARAIKMKCLECVNFEDVRQNVGECKAKSCALWSFRPFQTADDEDPNADQ